MKKNKPINLTKIELTYDDGTVIRVPEDKALRVGTAFMKLMGTEGVEWEVVEKSKAKKNFFTRLADKFLEI